MCLNLLFLYLFIGTFFVFSWVHFFMLIVPFLMSATSVFALLFFSTKRWLCLCFEYCLFLMYACVFFTLLNLLVLLVFAVLALNLWWCLQRQTGMWMIQCWDVALHQLFGRLWCMGQIWPTLSLYLISQTTNYRLCWYFGVTQSRMFIEEF